MDQDRIKRIRKMEEIYDRVVKDIRTLEEYQESGLWLEDYEADERGEIPSTLKRGVLSQDAFDDIYLPKRPYPVKKPATHNLFKIPTKSLLLVNGLLWTAIGTRIAIIGVTYYLGLESVKWWYYLLSVLVFGGFWFMFTGVVRKYAARIMAMAEPRTSIFKTFSVKGYLIIAFMITLGITLKRIPQVPDSFIAWFYSGLGPGLLSAGIRFIIRWWKAIRF